MYTLLSSTSLIFFLQSGFKMFTYHFWVRFPRNRREFICRSVFPGFQSLRICKDLQEFCRSLQIIADLQNFYRSLQIFADLQNFYRSLQICADWKKRPTQNTKNPQQCQMSDKSVKDRREVSFMSK